ncbi:hypothetical protein T484DRAFT_1742345 [Baffinella frigidus]|nr:hypothetical protein T484DRAFT_1742345 [Cryptophyta sp. CCMP2293]
MAPLVRFLGANGFPCGAYRPVLERLRASGLDVTTSDAWRHYTGEATWRKMADGLIEDTERQASKGRVVGVGHSFGGALLCLAAAQRPDLFERLIIVDPPM